MARRIDSYDYYRADENRLDAIKDNPICDECGEIITDEVYYDFYGHNICEDCLDQHKVYVCE